jgi:hypothetical protein
MLLVFSVSVGVFVMLLLSGSACLPSICVGGCRHVAEGRGNRQHIRKYLHDFRLTEINFVPNTSVNQDGLTCSRHRRSHRT